MDNEIVYSSKATDQKAQYDASAKRLLGQKIILAHILIRVVEEFKGMNADTVASLIEGEPYISQVPVEPGLTNKETVDARTGERIVGLNTENSEIVPKLMRERYILILSSMCGCEMDWRK